MAQGTSLRDDLRGRPRDLARVVGADIALVLHVGAMLAVMAVIAVLVYDRWGVGILRRSWINLDTVWAAAFVVAGLVTLFS